MSIDIAVLRVIKYEEQWIRVRSYLTTATLEAHTKLLVDDFDKYWKLYPDTQVVDMDVFRSLFFMKWHPMLSEPTQQVYNELMNRLCTDIPPAQTAGIVNTLLEHELATVVANLVEQYNTGAEMDLSEEVAKVTEVIRDRMLVTTSATYLSTRELNKESDSKHSFTWPWAVVQQHCRNMEGGDNIICAALSDVGKTTMSLQVAIHVAKQSQYPVIWFNNEGPGKRILKRSVGLALGLKGSQVDWLTGMGKVDEALTNYYQASPGIRVYDAHTWSSSQCEEIIRQTVKEDGGVAMVVWDMLDNVAYRSATAQDSRTLLEEKYQWVRGMATRYDFVNWQTSQQSHSALGNDKETGQPIFNKWPRKDELKESKIAKQGAADMILFMTQHHDPNMDTYRYLSAPKNKLREEGARAMHVELRYKLDIGSIYEEHIYEA